jgi:hypothetical protein
MEARVTKIANGYLVTSVDDEGRVVDTKAILKANTGKVPTKPIGLAVTSILGPIAKNAKKSRRKKTATEAA